MKPQAIGNLFKNSFRRKTSTTTKEADTPQKQAHKTHKQQTSTCYLIIFRNSSTLIVLPLWGSILYAELLQFCKSSLNNGKAL